MKSLKIHFLNVGHGDCTIIEFENHLTLVDINACKRFAAPTRDELKKKYSGSANYGSQSLSAYITEMKIEEEEKLLIDPVDYITSNFPGQSIFRYIQTHPDMDHMAGLHRLVNEKKVKILNFWDTHNAIEKEDKATKWSNVNFDKKDWATYQEIRSGRYGCPVLRLKQNQEGDFYSADGISIWAPFQNTEKDNPDADPNCFSYVLSILFGECRIVLGGDLPSNLWDKLAADNEGKLPKAHLLKASHHGRKSGYSLNAVKAMDPDVTVCSVGELHSKHDANASYERFSEKGCFSTVDHGTIIATCWEDSDVWLADLDGQKIIHTFD